MTIKLDQKRFPTWKILFGNLENSVTAEVMKYLIINVSHATNLKN